MDQQRECASCGCLSFQTMRRVYCEDCQAEHEVCPTCADELSGGEEGVRLVA
jgi:hypothetical protein